jgi:hypothetical protein
VNTEDYITRNSEITGGSNDDQENGKGMNNKEEELENQLQKIETDAVIISENKQLKECKHLQHFIPFYSAVHSASYRMDNGGSFPGSKGGRGVKVTTHLQLVPGSSNRGSIYSLPHTSLWRSS